MLLKNQQWDRFAFLLKLCYKLNVKGVDSANQQNTPKIYRCYTCLMYIAFTSVLAHTVKLHKESSPKFCNGCKF